MNYNLLSITIAFIFSIHLILKNVNKKNKNWLIIIFLVSCMLIFLFGIVGILLRWF
ncbi:Putative immunity protein [Lactococcus garvieae DCC43]|uniref:Putative immunity protein n=1 Tax=Lactococcus garvieae DCC43 TaxID=1231377 RepID=U2XRT5_9LACT|nr:Putative immunity protein [Lactococcus garvieae DCC43]